MGAAGSAGGQDHRPALAVPRLVGRDRELALLDQSLDEPHALVVLAGEAGIGKTRLLHELLARRAETALVAVCPPFREPYTLGPVVEAIRRLVDRVAGLPLTALAGALRSSQSGRSNCRLRRSHCLIRQLPGIVFFARSPN